MTAISRPITKLWIVANDTDASTLVTNATAPGNALGYIAGEIKEYDQTGGDQTPESDAHFGGFVDVETPRERVELSFEVTPSTEDGSLWESIAYNKVTATDVDTTDVYVMTGVQKKAAVFIEAIDGSGNAVCFGFNNCTVDVLEMNHNADENQTKTLNLSFSSEDENGTSNFMQSSTSTDASVTAITDLPAWSEISGL